MPRGFKGPALAGNPSEVRSAAPVTLPAKRGAAHMVTRGEPAEVDVLADARMEPVPTSSPMSNLMDDVVIAESDPSRATEQPAAQPEAVETVPEVPATEQPPAPASDDDVDDPRFRGKTKKDVYESLRHLERLAGRQGEELGHYRSYVDTVRAQQPQPKPPQPSPEENATLLKEMLENPTAFVKRTQAAALAQVQGALLQVELHRVRNENQTLMQDPSFANWLQAVPPHLVQAADQDPALSTFLFNQYRAAHNQPIPSASNSPAPTPAPTQTPVVSSGAGPVGMPSLQQRTKVMQAAASPGGAARPSTPAHTFTRSQIRKLMSENPSEYERILPEIVTAHREGRVKDA